MIKSPTLGIKLTSQQFPSFGQSVLSSSNVIWMGILLISGVTIFFANVKLTASLPEEKP
jgi:hypothetical protein